MPRPMGELRRLCLEWNSLVPIARERGIMVRPRRHFHMDRTVARQRVADLRASIAPFFAPQAETATATHSRTFGVEIECILPRHYSYEMLASAIREAGVMCQAEMYSHSTRSHWKIVRDGSVHGNGAEIVSPPLSGEAGLEALRTVCRVLTGVGCKVDKSCGLHVHVGCQGLQVEFFKTLVRLYRHYETAIDAFLSPSRRGNVNGFCQSSRVDYAALVRAETVQQVGVASGQTYFNQSRSSSRYRKLNLMSYPVYGTVEFRHHQGTVEARKAEMWVRFCLRMVETAVTTPLSTELDTYPTLTSLAQLVGLTQVEHQYFEERSQHFAARAQRRAA